MSCGVFADAARIWHCCDSSLHRLAAAALIQTMFVHARACPHTRAQTHTLSLFHTSMALLPTWFTSSGMPRALSISSKPVASVLLKSVCSWSNNALSSLWPSRLEGGPRRSSREFLRSGLKRNVQSISCFFLFKGKKKKDQSNHAHYFFSFYGLICSIWKFLG